VKKWRYDRWKICTKWGQGGGQLPPPQKIRKSKSRANVQHKSGEEWEIKKPKSAQFVGQTKAVGQYSLHSRAILAYYKKNWDQLCQVRGVGGRRNKFVQ
jgi:hypothetical protein